MNSKAAPAPAGRYLLVFVLVVGFCKAYAQQSETTKPAQTSIAENSIHEKGGELQKKVFTKIDSLSNKSANLLQTTTDSLNNLSSKIEGKITSKIDFLQQKLNKIQRMGNQQLSNATEKAGKLTKRIDSLQNLLTNKMAKLDKYTDAIPSTDGIAKLQIPELEKLSLPSIPKLNTDKLGIANLSLPDNSSLKSMVDEQLGKIGDLKNNDWIKSGLPRLGGQSNAHQIPNEVKEYSELLKDPSNIDQTIDSKVGQMSEFQSLNNETKELTAMKDLPESVLADLKRYQDTQAMKAEAKDVAVKKATDYFVGQQDKLSQAQGMMSKLKKKYSYVPDSRGLSTAVKATSLKDEPFA